MKSKIEREKSWHDERFSNPQIRDDEASKFYSICQSVSTEYQNFIFTHSAGRNVLEYGCGTGSQAFDIIEQDVSSVTGIDISGTAIEQANLIIEERGLQNRPIMFKVMNAEELEFPSNSIDTICGSAILHHLDIHKSMKSITRTLKPSGSAVFVEPLGHNLLINLYRKLTPNIRTEDEHPLLKSDIKLIEQYFGKVEIRFFYLFSLIAVPFAKMSIFNPLLNFLESLDRLILKVPVLKWQAWQVVIELSEPIQQPNDQI